MMLTSCTRRLLQSTVKRSFGTSVWGERNLEYLNQRFEVFLQDNEGDDFDQAMLPTSGNSFTSNGQNRRALVTPCVESSTEFIIKDLLSESWTVKGLAKPETNLASLRALFKKYLSSEPVEEIDQSGKRYAVLNGEQFVLEQRRIEEWTSSEYESFDFIYDELPVLNLDPNTNNGRPLVTTALGNVLKPGGLLFVQTPNAPNHVERKKLIRSMKGLYPDTHFEMIDSRRLTWVRQFLFMKTHVGDELSE